MHSYRPHQGPLGFDAPGGHYQTSISAPYARPSPYGQPGYGADPAAANAAAASGRVPFDPNVLTSGISSVAAAALQAGAAVSQSRAARWQAVTAGVPGVTPPGQRPDYYAYTPGGMPASGYGPQTISAAPPLMPLPPVQAPEAAVPGWVVALGVLAGLAAVGGIAYTVTR